MAHSNSEKSKKVRNKKKHTENMVPCMEDGNNKIFVFFAQPNPIRCRLLSHTFGSAHFCSANLIGFICITLLCLLLNNSDNTDKKRKE